MQFCAPLVSNDNKHTIITSQIPESGQRDRCKQTHVYPLFTSWFETGHITRCCTMAKTKKTARKERNGNTQTILQAEADRLRAQIKKLEEELQETDISSEAKPTAPEHPEPASTSATASAHPHPMKTSKHQKSEYPCKACPATFSTTTSLRRHKEREHDEFITVYQCDTCFSDFTRTDALKRHFNLKHNIQKVKRELYSIYVKPNNPKDLSKKPPVWTPPPEATTVTDKVNFRIVQGNNIPESHNHHSRPKSKSCIPDYLKQNWLKSSQKHATDGH